MSDDKKNYKIRIFHQFYIFIYINIYNIYMQEKKKKIINETNLNIFKQKHTKCIFDIFKLEKINFQKINK